MILYLLEGLVIDWCDQLAQVLKKQRRLLGCVAADRNPLNNNLYRHLGKKEVIQLKKSNTQIRRL